METTAGRWSLRVTPAQDIAVRRVLEATGESLNDFVVRNAWLTGKARRNQAEGSSRTWFVTT